MASGPPAKETDSAAMREIPKHEDNDGDFSWADEVAKAKNTWGSHADPGTLLSFDSMIPHEMDAALYAQETIDVLKPFLFFLHDCRGVIKLCLRNHLNLAGRTERGHESLRLNATDLVVAGMKVDVPLCLLREYNSMAEDDPRLQFYRSHSVWGTGRRSRLALADHTGFEFVDYGAFLDRFDTLKGVVCFLVYSAWDSACIALPNIALHPYPLCWRCHHFGEMKCSSCLVARYCSKQCQEQDWRLHKLACTALHGLKDRHVAYRF